MVSDDRSPMCSGWDWGRNARMAALQQTGERNYVDLEKTKAQVFLRADSGDGFVPSVRHNRIL